MMHEINVEKADSSLQVEVIFEELLERKLLLLLDFERLPTYKRYQYAAIAGDNTSTTDYVSRNCKLGIIGSPSKNKTDN